MLPFRIVLAGKQSSFLGSISENLENNPGFQVIGIVSTNIKSELLKYSKQSTDMLIIEVNSLKKIEMARQIKTLYPKVKILILMGIKSQEIIIQAIIAKLDGYIFKENVYSDLINAINHINQGEGFFDKTISNLMADIIYDKFVSKTVLSGKLTSREMEVLTLRCESKSCKEIGESLSISHSTVSNHLESIKKKLDIKTQSELMRYAIRQGLYHMPINDILMKTNKY
jgi:two-component system, NarL family, response regulator NreC